MFFACARGHTHSSYLREDGLRDVRCLLARDQLSEVELADARLVVPEGELVQQAKQGVSASEDYRVNLCSGVPLGIKGLRVASEAVLLSAVVPEVCGTRASVGGASCTEVVIRSTGYSSEVTSSLL